MTTGCIHVYQPMTGFHGPVVVDPQAPNFEGMALTVFCDRGDLLTAAEAKSLCRHVGTLFEIQGAEVTTYTSGEQLNAFDVGEPDPSEDEEGDAPVADLTLELRSRKLHVSNDAVSWALFLMSSTLVPAITESSFAVDVVIRDESGYVLVSDSLQGRLVRRLGLGAWGTNKVLDWFWREEEDRIASSDAAHRDLSADLYGQLSQLTFNAKMHWEMLSGVAASGREE